MAPAPDIAISIISYNTRELLRACLLALRERAEAGEATLQIIVPDNGSTDGSLEMVQAEFPEVEAFATGANLGYGRANNLGFQRARGRYFCALNSDAEVQPGALASLRDFLNAHPEAGGACPQLLYPDGRLQTSYGPDPDMAGIVMEQTYLYKLRRGMAVTDGTPSEAAPTEPMEVAQICGACQFIRSEAYEQVGGYDPAYFMYHEDVDLNIRLRKAGWKLYFVPQSHIVHHLGASSQRDWQTRARMVSAYNHSRYYYFSHHGTGMQGPLLKAMFTFGAGLRLLGWSLLAVLRPSAREKVKLFRIVLRNAVAMRPEAPTGAAPTAP